MAVRGAGLIMASRGAFQAFDASYLFPAGIALLGALLIAFGAGLGSEWIASLLVTAFYTWSPWHYTGQNYGISLMLLARRGVAVDPTTKQWLKASFVLSFLLSPKASFFCGSVVYADGGSDAALRPDAWPAAYSGQPGT